MTPPIETPRAWDDACRRSCDERRRVLRDTMARASCPNWTSGEDWKKHARPAHARVFGRGKRDEGRDEALGRRIGAMREIVTAQNLDVAETAHAAASWALAERVGEDESIQGASGQVGMRLNTCRIINNTLTTRQGSDGGADDFLPVLVYVTLRANPDRLSNLRYIQRFRGESRLPPRLAYFFTNLVSGAVFRRARARFHGRGRNRV